jgi:AhpD family alkylhydroperoxidase
MAQLDVFELSPETMKMLMEVEDRVSACGLEFGFVELLRLRASQINGCSYCVDMHARKAREHGESNQRVDLVAAWREARVFDDRERAALGWTEALTRLDDHHAVEEARTAIDAHLSSKEIVDLSIAIGMINLFNRLGVACEWQHPLAAQ